MQKRIPQWDLGIAGYGDRNNEDVLGKWKWSGGMPHYPTRQQTLQQSPFTRLVWSCGKNIVYSSREALCWTAQGLVFVIRHRHCLLLHTLWCRSLSVLELCPTIIRPRRCCFTRLNPASSTHMGSSYSLQLRDSRLDKLKVPYCTIPYTSHRHYRRPNRHIDICFHCVWTLHAYFMLLQDTCHVAKYCTLCPYYFRGCYGIVRTDHVNNDRFLLSTDPKDQTQYSVDVIGPYKVNARRYYADRFSCRKMCLNNVIIIIFLIIWYSL